MPMRAAFGRSYRQILVTARWSGMTPKKAKAQTKTMGKTECKTL